MTKVLYILGSQRGGTTVVGRVLGELPGASFVGEVRKLWEVGLPKGRACGCGAAHAECPVWSQIVPLMLAERSPQQLQAIQQAASPIARSWSTAAHLVRHGVDDDARAYADLLASTYAALARALHDDVIIDGSKLPADAVINRLRPDVDAYLLHLVRDPRGVAYSQVSRRNARRRPRPIHVLQASTRWLLRHRMGDELLDLYGPDRSIGVEYERFVRDPNGVIDDVAALLGLAAPTAPIVVDGRAEVGVAHTPAGAGRFRPDTVQLRQDLRWQEGLTRADRALTAVATRGVARRHGYTHSR